MSLELAKYGKKVDQELQLMMNYHLVQYMSYREYNSAIDAEQLQKALQQMVSPNAEDSLRLLMDEYIKYKKGFVKHLQFNPDNQNLSKFFISPIPEVN